jgi:hypothetical protein
MNMQTPKHSELKPCPFCGGKAEHNDGGNSVYGRFWWVVGCNNCQIFFRDQEKWDHSNGSKLLGEPKECFAVWNTRAVNNYAKLVGALDNLRIAYRAEFSARGLDPDECELLYAAQDALAEAQA